MRDRPLFVRDPRGSSPVSALTAVPASIAGPEPGARAVPGEVGIWVFILGDMTMFGAFFAAFLAQRGQDPDLFAQGREALTLTFGAVNTLVLLTSSWFVALAMRAHAEGDRKLTGRLVAGAGVCAAVFAAVKVTEWGIKVADGHTPTDSLFFTYYYVLTGVHFLHLLIGAAVLNYWWRLMRRAAAGRDERRAVGCCASYWHMVDLLWLVLFPVLYLAAT